MVFKPRVACWSLQRYEETDPYVDNLALVLLHTWWCFALKTVSTLNDAPGNHHAINDAVPFLSWWGVTEATFSVGSVTPKISLCFMLPWEWEPSAAFGITLRKSWYKAMLNTHISWYQRQIFFKAETGIPLLSRIRNIDGAMRLFQINDLLMFGYACPSHVRPGL